MVFGKYNKDYELRESLTAGGRTVSEAVYIGPYFRFNHNSDKLTRVKRLTAAMTALGGLSFFVTLIVTGDILLKWYVMAPMIFNVLPISQLVMCVFRAFTAKERVTRREKDRISERLAPWSAVLMALSGLSLIGQIVYDIANGISTFNIIIHVCTILMIVSGAVIFSVRNGFEMVEAD